MALLQYDVSIVGTKRIDDAFASIEKRMRRHNTTMASIANAPGGRSGGARDPAAAKLREQHRIRNAINNLNLRDIRAEERERLAGIRRNEDYRRRVQTTSLRMEQRERERAERLAGRAAARELRERSAFVRSTVGHGLTRTAGAVGAVGRTGAAMVGVGGAALAASAVAGATRLDEMTRRLVISGRQGGEQAKFNPEDLRRRFEKTSIETGVAGEDIAAGAQAFVTKTGDLDTAINNHKIFAQVAQATGAAVNDVASAAADMSEKMGIKSVEDMKDALAALTLQGKKGAFELKDAAEQLPEILSAAASFGVSGTGGLKQLGGFLQIARQASGSGAETATATVQAFTQLKAKSAKIQSGEAFGGRAVSVFEGNDPTKGLRNFNEILGDVMQASRGNLVELQEVFDVRGIKAVNPLIKTFREASEKAGGGDKGAKAGRAAVMAQLQNATTVTGGFAEVEKDAGDAMKSFSVQMAIVQAEFKQAIAGEIMPQLMKLGPQLRKLVPFVGRAVKVFVDLVEFFMNHPFKSIAMVVAAQLAADFAKARISSMVTGFIEKIFQKIRLPALGGGGGSLSGGGSGGVAAAGGGSGGFLSRPTAAGALGAVGLGATLGLTVGTAILTAGVVNFERGEAEMKTSGAALNRLRELAAGPATEESKREAQEIVNQQKSKVAEVEKGGMISTLFGRGVAESIGVERPEELKTQQSFYDDMRRLFDTIVDKTEQQRKAAVEAAEAAKSGAEAQKQAAGKGGTVTPNRGNSPSPVKG